MAHVDRSELCATSPLVSISWVGLLYLFTRSKNRVKSGECCNLPHRWPNQRWKANCHSTTVRRRRSHVRSSMSTSIPRFVLLYRV